MKDQQQHQQSHSQHQKTSPHPEAVATRRQSKSFKSGTGSQIKKVGRGIQESGASGSGPMSGPYAQKPDLLKFQPRDPTTFMSRRIQQHAAASSVESRYAGSKSAEKPEAQKKAKRFPVGSGGGDNRSQFAAEGSGGRSADLQAHMQQIKEISRIDTAGERRALVDSTAKAVVVAAEQQCYRTKQNVLQNVGDPRRSAKKLYQSTGNRVKPDMAKQSANNSHLSVLVPPPASQHSIRGQLPQPPGNEPLRYLTPNQDIEINQGKVTPTYTILQKKTENIHQGYIVNARKLPSGHLSSEYNGTQQQKFLTKFVNRRDSSPMTNTVFNQKKSVTSGKISRRGMAYLCASKKYDDQLKSDNIISKTSIKPADQIDDPIIEADQIEEDRPLQQVTMNQFAAVQALTIHSNLTFKLPTENSTRNLQAEVLQNTHDGNKASQRQLESLMPTHQDKQSEFQRKFNQFGENTPSLDNEEMDHSLTKRINGGDLSPINNLDCGTDGEPIDQSIGTGGHSPSKKSERSLVDQIMKSYQKTNVQKTRIAKLGFQPYDPNKSGIYSSKKCKEQSPRGSQALSANKSSDYKRSINERAANGSDLTNMVQQNIRTREFQYTPIYLNIDGQQDVKGASVEYPQELRTFSDSNRSNQIQKFLASRNKDEQSIEGNKEPEQIQLPILPSINKEQKYHHENNLEFASPNFRREHPDESYNALAGKNYLNHISELPSNMFGNKGSFDINNNNTFGSYQTQSQLENRSTKRIQSKRDTKSQSQRQKFEKKYEIQEKVYNSQYQKDAREKIKAKRPIIDQQKRSVITTYIGNSSQEPIVHSGFLKSGSIAPNISTDGNIPERSSRKSVVAHNRKTNNPSRYERQQPYLSNIHIIQDNQGPAPASSRKSQRVSRLRKNQQEQNAQIYQKLKQRTVLEEYHKRNHDATVASREKSAQRGSRSIRSKKNSEVITPAAMDIIEKSKRVVRNIDRKESRKQIGQSESQILLARSSNAKSHEFGRSKSSNGQYLYSSQHLKEAAHMQMDSFNKKHLTGVASSKQLQAIGSLSKYNSERDLKATLAKDFSTPSLSQAMPKKGKHYNDVGFGSEGTHSPLSPRRKISQRNLNGKISIVQQQLSQTEIKYGDNNMKIKDSAMHKQNNQQVKIIDTVDYVQKSVSPSPVKANGQIKNIISSSAMAKRYSTSKVNEREMNQLKQSTNVYAYQLNSQHLDQSKKTRQKQQIFSIDNKIRTPQDSDLLLSSKDIARIAKVNDQVKEESSLTDRILASKNSKQRQQSFISKNSQGKQSVMDKSRDEAINQQSQQAELLKSKQGKKSFRRRKQSKDQTASNKYAEKAKIYERPKEEQQKQLSSKRASFLQTQVVKKVQPNEKAKKVIEFEFEQMKSRGSISPFGPESQDELYMSNYNQDLRNYNKDLKNILNQQKDSNEIISIQQHGLDASHEGKLKHLTDSGEQLPSSLSPNPKSVGANKVKIDSHLQESKEKQQKSTSKLQENINNFQKYNQKVKVQNQQQEKNANASFRQQSSRAMDKIKQISSNNQKDAAMPAAVTQFERRQESLKLISSKRQGGGTQSSADRRHLATPAKQSDSSGSPVTKRFFHRARNTLASSNNEMISMVSHRNRKQSCQTNHEIFSEAQDENKVVQQNDKNQKKYSLDNFQIIRTLGQGSFGIVQLIRDQRSDQYFALKCLQKNGIRSKKHIQHILNERDILKQFKPNDFCCNIFESLQDSHNLYMVLEFLPGGELIKRIRKQVFMSEADTRFYLAEIVLAVESLHNRGIIYRDLKPENILLDSEGHVKLIDFGFAKKMNDIRNDRSYTNCGTPGYCAPEVMLANVGHNYKADMWSIGILMCEMIGGFTPFENTNEAKNPKSIMEKCRNGKLNLPKNLLGNARELVRLLLTDDPVSRLDIDEIKKHPFFRGVNWNAISKRSSVPPFVPEQMSFIQGTIPENSESTLVDQQQFGQHSNSNTYRIKSIETLPNSAEFMTEHRELERIPEFPNEPSGLNTNSHTRADNQSNPFMRATHFDSREIDQDRVTVIDQASPERQAAGARPLQPQKESSGNMNQTLENNSKKSMNPSFRSSVKYSATGGTGGPNAYLNFRKASASRVLGDYQMTMVNRAFTDF